MNNTIEPKFPDACVALEGEDGNIFAIIGRVQNALRKSNATAEELEKFFDAVTACQSYDDALLTVHQWVRVQ